MTKKYTINTRRPVHGTGGRPLGKPIKWWGGIFRRQPINPNSIYRRGVFAARYARDPRFSDDSGVLAPYSLKRIPGTTMYENGAPLFLPGNSISAGLSNFVDDAIARWNGFNRREKTWLSVGILTGAILLLRK